MTVQPLRVLIANERADRIALVTTLVAGLGHHVIAGSTNVADVGALTSNEHPDVALVGLGTSSSHALELIERIVREADCPVIAVLEGRDSAFVNEAAKRARHHPAPLRGVPQPAGRIRPPRADRARQGNPHGALPGR
jgi:CheY-like chemotaxis protein